jgi:hypothetical protein
MRSYVRGDWFTINPSFHQVRRLAGGEPSRKSVAGSTRSFPCGSFFRRLDLSAEIGKTESRRADSHRFPAPATSERSGVADRWMGLQIPHSRRDFCSPYRPPLRDIAFGSGSKYGQHAVKLTRRWFLCKPSGLQCRIWRLLRFWRCPSDDVCREAAPRPP